MKIVCKHTTALGFNLTDVTTVLSEKFDYSFGGYGLEIGQEYIVMGIALYKDANCLYYLVDTDGRPDWFPYLLFEVSNNLLHSQWFLKIIEKEKNNDIYALWGFEELCNDETFYDRLTDRDEEAMQIYFRRKIELEKELCQNNTISLEEIEII